MRYKVLSVVITVAIVGSALGITKHKHHHHPVKKIAHHRVMRRVARRHVERGSFLADTCSSTEAFSAMLESRPETANDMARCFGTSKEHLMSFVRDNIHLGRLAHSGKYEMWGLSRNHGIHKTWHYFKAGEKVWETSNGDPVFRWVCSNPLGSKLPVEAAAEVVAPPPPPPPAPAPAPAPEPVPAPAPAPAPAPVPAPEPAPAPAPAPEPAPAPTPAPAPAPAPVMAQAAPAPVWPHYRPLRVQVGVTEWNDVDTNTVRPSGGNQGLVSLGASYDIWHSGMGGALAIYFDSTGLLQDHPTYRFYGGGLNFRQYLLDRTNEIRPYVGIGLGGYHIDLRDQENVGVTRFGGKAFIGLEDRSGFFVEAQYNYFGDKVGLVRPTLFLKGTRELGTFGFDLGYRF